MFLYLSHTNKEIFENMETKKVTWIEEAGIIPKIFLNKLKKKQASAKIQAPKENVLIQLSEHEERLPKYWDNFDRSLFLRYKQAQIS